MHIDRIISFFVDKEKDRQEGRLRMRVKWNRSAYIVYLPVGFRVKHDKERLIRQKSMSSIASRALSR